MLPLEYVDRRWLTLSTGCLLMVCAGNIYAFGLWSGPLVETWPQEDKDRSGVISNRLYECLLVGAYIPLGGVFYQRDGTKKALLMAAVCNNVAFFIIIGQFFTGDQHSPDLISYIGFFLMGQATSYTDCTVVSTNVANWAAAERTSAVALLKGYFGLSASILSMMAATGVTTKQFLVGLGFANTFLLVLGAFVCKVISISDMNQNQDRKKSLHMALLVELVIAGVLFIRSIFFGVDNMIVSLLFAITVIPLLCSTYVMPILCKGSERDYAPMGKLEPPEDSSGDGHLVEIPSSETEKPVNNTKPLDVLDAMLSIEFWLFFTSLLIIMGSGLFIVSNASKMVEAKGGTSSQVHVFVSIVSVSNCLGRIGVGFIADHAILLRHGICRISLLMVSCMFMALAHMLFAACGVVGITIAGFFGGLAYGSAWTLDPSILADIVGLKYFGKIYAFLGFAPTLGSMFFSTLLATHVYESNAHILEGTQHRECHGSSCFGLAHVITACINLLAAVVLVPLLRRRLQGRMSS
mmetsp:Transcript_22343/g.35745  ORF Transcript_22343/g.35745 Transcript_22343/m.35745 type:complete len:522 (+) Transcript_22343:155-1720(+)